MYPGSTGGGKKRVFPSPRAGPVSYTHLVEIPAPNDEGWYRQEIVLTPKEGVSIGTGDNAAGGVAIAKEGKDLEQVLFIKDEEGNIFRAGFSYSLDTVSYTHLILHRISLCSGGSSRLA